MVGVVAAGSAAKVSTKLLVLAFLQLFSAAANNGYLLLPRLKQMARVIARVIPPAMNA